ncbi:MAG: hypothetical protein Fur003_3410 [Candidatus Dojkabacteria bacterium]
MGYKADFHQIIQTAILSHYIMHQSFSTWTISDLHDYINTRYGINLSNTDFQDTLFHPSVFFNFSESTITWSKQKISNDWIQTASICGDGVSHYFKESNREGLMQYINDHNLIIETVEDRTGKQLEGLKLNPELVIRNWEDEISFDKHFDKFL